MKKTLFILAVSLILGSASFAQVKVGLTAGLNAANFVYSEKDSDPFNTNRYGFFGGLVIDLGLTKNFSIVPEILYMQKGAGVTINEDSRNSGTMMTNLDYVQVPLNLTLKINMGSSAKFLILAGPYAGYAISAKSVTNATIDGVKEKETENIDLGKGEDEINPLDMGVNVGLGFEIGKSFFKIQVNAGLTNLFNHDHYTLNNGGIALSYGYYF